MCKAVSQVRTTAAIPLRPLAQALAPVLTCLGLCTLPLAQAQERVELTGQRASTLPPVAATVESVTSLQIDETINTPTTAGVLQNLPSVHVRERYIGDRNGILVMRVNSSVASAQTTVYADGLLLSNFLNNSFSTAPRWGVVSPEEIERVEVIYGPFSALYPGNSAGGVVRIATRTPTRFEAHARLDFFSQAFSLYGTRENFNGRHASAALGDKQGALGWWVGIDHLSSRSQPQTFAAATPKSGAAATAGTFTVVDGSRVIRDIDTSGNARTTVASTGIDDTRQNMAKVRLSFDLSSQLQAQYTGALWRNESDTSVQSYLRDGSGNTVYNAGAAMANPFKFVRIDGVDYTFTASPSNSSSQHSLHGVELRSKTGGNWDFELIASQYRQDKDDARAATPNNGLDSGLGANPTPGQLTDASGTGWWNVDMRGVYRMGSGVGSHTWSAGAHADRYELQSKTWGTAAAPLADWRTSGPGTLSTNSYGKTRTEAIYLQDDWRFAPGWSLVAGARQERWTAFDGSNFNVANAAPNPQNLVYANRSYSHLSPKAYVSWQLDADWLLRASLGKAVRYPTVAEMFQTFNGPGGIRFNDPSLKPEQVLSSEWVAERRWTTSMMRTSVFTEEKSDALISQTNVTVTPTISSIQNVDRVRTRGIEWVGAASDVLIRGLELNGSVTYTRSTITRNRLNPGLEGTDQPRIPRWRSTLVATYRATEQVSASLAWRFSGHQHNALYNTTLKRYNDVNPDVYGAVSQYSVVDAKLLWRLQKGLAVSVGVNNLGNYKYYVNPNPYPQRTVFTSLKYDL